MSIRLNAFGGIIPRTEPTKLPDNAAQTAQNCRLVRGVIEPISVLTPFTTMVETDGTLKSEIPSADLISITKPDAPKLASGWELLPGGIIMFEPGIRHIAQPYWWLKVYARTWTRYIKEVRDGADIVAEHVVEKLQEVETVPKFGTVDYTEAGFTFSIELPAFEYTFEREIDGMAVEAYHIVGPLYQFVLTPSAAGGGPDDTILLPFGATEADSVLPTGVVPLTYGGNVYAQFQVERASGVIYSTGDNPIVPRSAKEVDVRFPLDGDVSVVSFVVNLNYTDPSRNHYHYIQTAVTNDDEEGPASELSKRITLQPGEYAVLDVTRPTGYNKNKLYRSTTGGDDFLLLDDVNADAYTDILKTVTSTVLPPFGNYPDCNAATFLEGSVIHPDQFAAAYYEDHLYLSDFFRFWVWPEEYAIPFPANIDAIALSGNTIVVFAGDRVYGVSGGNPEHMAKYLVTDSFPLLSKRTIARIGQTVLYASNDGLIGVTGGQATNLSEKHYTRTSWMALDPATWTAKVEENTVYLEKVDGSGLRIDLEESEIALTTYTATTGVSLTWKSKKFLFEDKTIFDYARIVATDDVTLNVYADGVLVETETVTNDTPVQLTDVVHAKAWEFEVVSDGIIREMEFYDRQTIPAGDTVTLTPESVPLWENIWLKFQDRNKFVAGVLTVQGAGAVPVKFYRDGTTLAHTVNVTDGHVFMLPRDMAKAAYWRVNIQTELPIERLELFAQVTQPIQNIIQEFHPGGIAPWRLKRYELSDKATLTGAVVHARTDVILNIYQDGASDVTQQVSIPEGGHMRIPDIGPCRWVEFDFDVSDFEVSEATLYASPTPILGAEGVSLNKPPCWRGNRYRFADRGVFACGTLGARSYDDITLTLYAEGEEVYSEAIESGEMFYLPSTLEEASHWEVDVESADEIDSLVLLPRVRVPASGNLHLTANDTGLPPWSAARYEFPEAVEFRSGMVKADEYPLEIRLRSGGTEYDVDVMDAAEFLMPDMGRVSDLELRFPAPGTGLEYNDDHLVNEILLHPKEVIPVKQHGLVLRSAEGVRGWRRKVLTFPEIGSFSVLRVVASSYTDCYFRLLLDGVSKYDAAVTSDTEIKLPEGLPNAREWEMDLQHGGEVYELHLMGRVNYAVKNGLVLIRREQEPFTWLDRRILAPMPMSFSSGRVISSAYPVTMRLYYGAQLLHERQVFTDKAFRLPKMFPRRMWTVDFVPVNAGTSIHEAALATSMAALRQ